MDKIAEHIRQETFKALFKLTFPTIVNVVSLSDETSMAMKADNQRRRREAFRKRPQRGSRPYKFSRKGFHEYH